ncbi:CPBP family intramembrane metalloprotease [bacterium]|nr:CPBP family intramembrane metalloprotease [bacterium]
MKKLYLIILLPLAFAIIIGEWQLANSYIRCHYLAHYKIKLLEKTTAITKQMHEIPIIHPKDIPDFLKRNTPSGGPWVKIPLNMCDGGHSDETHHYGYSGMINDLRSAGFKPIGVVNTNNRHPYEIVAMLNFYQRFVELWQFNYNRWIRPENLVLAFNSLEKTKVSQIAFPGNIKPDLLNSRVRPLSSYISANKLVVIMLIILSLFILDLAKCKRASCGKCHIFIEIFSIFIIVFIFMTLRDGRSFQRSVDLIVPGVVILYCLLSNSRLNLSFREMGFIPNLWKAPLIYNGIVTVLGIGLMVIIAVSRGSLSNLNSSIILKLVGSIVGASFQQFLIQSFWSRRIKMLINNEQFIAVITAIMFSLIHLPNFSLMIATLIFGYFWTLSFCRHRNLYLIVASHGLLVIGLRYLVEDPLVLSLRVGPNFLW